MQLVFALVWIWPTLEQGFYSSILDTQLQSGTPNKAAHAQLEEPALLRAWRFSLLGRHGHQKLATLRTVKRLIGRSVQRCDVAKSVLYKPQIGLTAGHNILNPALFCDPHSLQYSNTVQYRALTSSLSRGHSITRTVPQNCSVQYCSTVLTYSSRTITVTAQSLQ